MTNAEIIQAIKAEIERRIIELSEAETDYHEEGCDSISALLISGISELQKILSFISTFESEKPINLKGLEKEIEEYFPESTFNTGFNYDDLQEIARHFAQWGAEHLIK